MPGIPNEVVDYLGLHHVITLGTSSFTGMPHADTVVYGSDATNIYFYADLNSSLARNIKDSHYVSFTIDDYTTDWKKLRELQGVGRSGVCDEQLAFQGATQMAKKFGQAFAPPAGALYSVAPNEMHFVDYDYETLSSNAPDVSSRVYQIQAEPTPPSQGPVATNLDRTTYEPGEVIFRPGSLAGQYFVVVEGEVEIRSEGYGADQTVTRVRAGGLFGDRSALLGQHGALTANAVTRTVLLAVEREALRDMMLPGRDT
jgi:hypothetical protein